MAPDRGSPSRSAARSLAGLCDGWRDTEGGRRDKSDGSLGFGALLRLTGRRHARDLSVRDGYLIVSLFWLRLSLLGAWPLADGFALSPVDALFESASGLTTTGATVITEPDDMPRSLLFHRQQLQWLGGMGLI